MGNKVFVKRGYDKRYGSWIAKTNQVDYYLIFNFGSSTMTSSTLYKITKEIFDEIDDEMDFKQIEPKTHKIYRYANGMWMFEEEKQGFVNNWAQELDRFYKLKYFINLERKLDEQNTKYTYSQEKELAQFCDEKSSDTTTYYTNIMSFDNKNFYVFTYKWNDYKSSYPINKDEYVFLTNNTQTIEDAKKFQKLYEKRFIYDNEYIYAEVEETIYL